MNNTVDLLCLPHLVWCHITQHLQAEDLVSLSGTCHHLRDILNHNYFWYKYSTGGQALTNVRSLVDPEFQIPSTNTTEYCEAKLNCLRQSRLVHNYRQGKYIEHSYESKLKEAYDGIHSRDGNSLREWQNIYNEIYYFFIELTESDNDVVHVLNIEDVPYIVTSFLIPDHKEVRNDQFYTLHISGNKLVILAGGNCIDVFGISLPNTCFPHLHTLKVDLSKSHVLSHFVFVEAPDSSHYEVYDIHTGVEVRKVYPKTQGVSIKVLMWSRDYKLVLFCQGSEAPYTLCCYDTEALDYSSFSTLISEEIYHEHRFVSRLVDDHYVVIFTLDCFDGMVVNVYDCETSQLLGKMIFEYDDINPCLSAIIKDKLVLVSDETCELFIRNIRTLEFLTIIDLESYLNEWRIYFLDLHLSYLLFYYHINDITILDLTEKKKIFNKIINCERCFFNNSRSKAVFVNKDSENMKLHVISFW